MKTLTLGQTLHPERTELAADSAVSPWETFFVEARGDIPVAIAEPVQDIETNPAADAVGGVVVMPSKDEVTSFPSASVEEAKVERQPRPKPGKGCFYLEGIVGCALTLVAVLVVFSLELSGSVVYIVAAGFNSLATEEHILPQLVKAIFSLVVRILMLADSVCLFCSVMISEVLALATSLVVLVLCTLSCNSVEAATQWHHYIRKTSHMTRWAFRSFHQGWAPERIFPFDNVPTSNNTAMQSDEGEKGDDLTVLHVSTASVAEGNFEPSNSKLKKKTSYSGDEHA